MINHWVKTFLLITQLITHLLKNGSSIYDTFFCLVGFLKENNEGLDRLNTCLLFFLHTYRNVSLFRCEFFSCYENYFFFRPHSHIHTLSLSYIYDSKSLYEGVFLLDLLRRTHTYTQKKMCIYEDIFFSFRQVYKNNTFIIFLRCVQFCRINSGISLLLGTEK